VIARSPVAATRVADLTARDIEGYMRWRRAHKYHRRSRDAVVVVGGTAPSTSTTNRDLALISAALGRLVRLGLAPTNVAKAVKRGREPVRARPILTREEAKALLDAADPHLRVLLVAGLCTGARPSELLALKWRDVSLDGNGSITVYRQKVELGDTLPLHPRLGEELRALRASRPEARDDDAIFLSSRGTEGWGYKRAFAKALKKAGLAGKRITLYAATRHTLASHWKGTPGDLQALLGHRSILTTQRYIRALNDRTRASLEAVDLVG
jgi:integrase/recombinase XerD